MSKFLDLDGLRYFFNSIRAQFDGRYYKQSQIDGFLSNYYTKSQTDSQMETKAPIASPTFTGTPKAPTASSGTSTTQIATTEFVTSGLNTKAPIASPTFTGVPKAPTPDGTATLALANVNYVTSQISAIPSASTSERGMMSASDKKYIDEMRIRTYEFYHEYYERLVTLGNQTRCFVYLRRGNLCMVTVYFHLTVGGSNVPANSIIMQELPSSGAHVRVTLATNSGDSIINAYIDENGDLTNSSAMTAGKTYYGNLTYVCGSASNWYDLLT